VLDLKRILNKLRIDGMRWHCSFNFHYVTNKIELICKLFCQNPQSLIYFEFCKYLLWVLAIEVNSLDVSSKRIQRCEGKQEDLLDLITALVKLNLVFSTFGHFGSFYWFLRKLGFIFFKQKLA